MASVELCDQAQLTRAVIESLAASGVGPPPEFAQELANVRPQHLAVAFQAIDEHWGSVEAYFERVLGLDAKRRRRLAGKLLEG
jgi:hypothetical protein